MIGEILVLIGILIGIGLLIDFVRRVIKEVK